MGYLMGFNRFSIYLCLKKQSRGMLEKWPASLCPSHLALHVDSAATAAAAAGVCRQENRLHLMAPRLHRTGTGFDPPRVVICEGHFDVDPYLYHWMAR